MLYLNSMVHHVISQLPNHSNVSVFSDHIDYLFYSRLHLPSLHLSGLATTRLSPTFQAQLAFHNQPAPPTPRATSQSPHTHSRQSSEPPPVAPPAPGNILLSLQHDIGRYNGEYTYSAQDGMFGIRGLYNVYWKDPSVEEVNEVDGLKSSEEEGKRIDEEEMMEGGLGGRVSVGGEAYFGGVSFLSAASLPEYCSLRWGEVYNLTTILVYFVRFFTAISADDSDLSL